MLIVKTPPLSLTEAVRKRPGMYFGDIEHDGANIPVFELISNALDQHLAGHVSTIEIQIFENKITVSNDGIEFPFSKPSPDGTSSNLVEYYLKNHHLTPSADNHSPHIHILEGGLGLAVLNAGSEKLSIRSSDGTNNWEQQFGKGDVLTKLTRTKTSLPKGSTVELTLDRKVFTNAEPNLGQLRKIIFELVHLYPNLTIEFQDERFRSHNGLIDLANILIQNRTACSPSHKQFSFAGKKGGVEIQVAALGHGDKETQTSSWVNGVSSVDGGSHVAGLKKALENAQWRPQIAMIHVVIHDPKFASPRKDKLANPEVATIIQDLLEKPLLKL